MNIVLVTRDPCGVCGYHRKGFMFPSMRINKRSMRSVGRHLVVLPGRCEECGMDTGLSRPPLRWQMDSESAEKVWEYRLRRWPELEGS